jgi:hypothetical protein
MENTAVVVLVGLVFAGIGAWSAADAWNWSDKAVATTGKLTRVSCTHHVERDEDSERREWRCNTRVRFVDQDGETQESDLRLVRPSGWKRGPQPFKAGGVVDLTYDPIDPTEVRDPHRSTPWWLGILFGLAGLTFAGHELGSRRPR